MSKKEKEQEVLHRRIKKILDREVKRFIAENKDLYKPYKNIGK